MNESERKPNKLWIGQEKEFHKKLMPKWLCHNNVLMYSTHNKGSSVDAERVTRTLTSKICKK